ncbi:MAG: hypothetical protein Q8P90_05265 [bacterium]|nr:hypothetical protein [bacterium]
MHLKSRKGEIAFYTAVALFSGIYFSILQWPSSFADPDSFYHARIIQQISEHGLLYAFPWLQATTLAEKFTDHHLLYHLFLVPFTTVLDPATAVKAGQVVLLVILSLVLVSILRRWKLSYSWAALFILYTISPFVVRINLVKATALAMIILLGIFILLLERKYGLVALLTVAYTWAHGGFILAWLVAMMIWLADIVTQSIKRKRIYFEDPRGVIMVTLGIIAGIIINPYFPQNLFFFWEQVVQIGFINYQEVIEVGGEWYPFALDQLTGLLSILLIAVLLACMIFVWQRKKYFTDIKAVSLLFIAIMFFFATLRSRRNVEYLVPFLWLWTCYLVLPYLESGAWKVHLKKLKQQLGKVFTVLAVYLLIVIPLASIKNVFEAQEDLSEGIDLSTYQAAGEYMKENIPVNTNIFHTQWDEFPMLYYQNSNNYYLVGLDATFMYLDDADKYRRWREISEGNVKEHLSTIINEEFNSSYVFIGRSTKSSQLLDAYLFRDPEVILEYEDEYTRIYNLGT